MIDIVKNIGERRLKNFSVVLALILSVITHLLFRKGQFIYIYFYIASCIVILSGIFSPCWLLVIYRVLNVIGFLIAKFNTALILVSIFYFIFTPIGFFCKILRIDLLDEKIDRGSLTYWKRREKPAVDKSRYESLF